MLKAASVSSKLSQLDCENPEVRNRKGAESGLVKSKVFDLISLKENIGVRSEIHWTVLQDHDQNEKKFKTYCVYVYISVLYMARQKTQTLPMK